MRRRFLRGHHDGAMHSRALLVLFVAAASIPAGATTLYKSVDANGAVMFSDIPPPSSAKLVEMREIGMPSAAVESAGAPYVAAPGAPVASLEQVYNLIDADEALAKANARVDQAERGLAMARKTVASRFEGLRLVSRHENAGDAERIAFYENDLKIARRELVELLKARQKNVAPPGTAYVVGVQPISAQAAARKIASR